MTKVTNPYLKILDEITPSSNYIPKKEEYVAWHKTHYKTITQQLYSDFCMQELCWAFQEFKNLVNFLEYEQTIIEANNRFLLLDKENDEEVTEWLLDYENVYEIAEHFYCLHFEWEDDKIEGDKIVVSKELDIKIALSDFKEFIVFEENFRPFLTKFKEKLSTKELKPFDTSLQSMLEFHKNF
jgi:hypothetical protein